MQWKENTEYAESSQGKKNHHNLKLSKCKLKHVIALCSN